MADYKVGFGKPSRDHMFKKGVSGNPKGRPRHEVSLVAEIVGKVLNAQVQYRENNKVRTASQQEVRLRLLMARAIKGDVDAAGLLLDRRTHALSEISSAARQIVVVGFLPDFPGQTAAQKTQTLRSGTLRNRRRKVSKPTSAQGEDRDDEAGQ